MDVQEEIRSELLRLDVPRPLSISAKGRLSPESNNITPTGYDLRLTLTCDHPHIEGSVSTGSKDSALEMQLGAKLNSIFRVCV